MTEFQPKVAYRILNERYDRLVRQKGDALYNFFAATVDGHWYDPLFYGLDHEVKVLEGELDRLWPVLEYLKVRISEEEVTNALG